MKKEISEILKKYVEVYGFVSVDEYKSTRASLLKNDVFSNYEGFLGYKTIITLGIAYPSKRIKKRDKKIGLLSRYSYGLDYHIVFKEKLNSIVNELKELRINCLPSVDTGFIDERWASYVAHMGFLGRNQFLIDETYGSYLYLATILVDVDIEKSIKLLDTCGDCDLCVRACPTNALEGKFHNDLCLSHITQSKHELSEYEISKVNDLVYGCDICQVVCPKNKGIDFHIHEEFEPAGIEEVDLLGILKMSNKQYKELYGNNASSWKGATIIKRNALCLLGNRGITEAIEIIDESLEKYRDVLWYNSVALKVKEMLERKI
jgi:epoxyqueuosine reductase